MVRTASINMHLHGFAKPDIRNHDTLSSTDYWDERFDVILANPPFMTPKGGIQPHKKFSIKANRAEVLFVDYIANHLNPVSSRAGIVVPEGIIFQSGKAYKELRKKLVEEYLYAVVSLPAGVFQPYSGVKTSVLLFDKQLAKKKDILSIDITNIGTTLDAKQSKKKGSQLPEAIEVIEAYETDREFKSSIAHLVAKSRISQGGEYNLTGSRYLNRELINNSDYQLVSLGDIIVESRERVKNRKIPVWSVSNKYGFIDPREHFSKRVASDDISNYKIVNNNYFAYNPSRINVGSLALNDTDLGGCVSPMYVVFKADDSKIEPKYLLCLLESDIFNDFVSNAAQGAVRAQFKYADLANFKIPLPPLEVQRQIVAELDGYQKIIDAANTIVQSYKPTIKINPDWEMVPIRNIATFIRGVTFSVRDKVDIEDSRAVFVATTKAAQEDGIRIQDLVPVAISKIKKEETFLRNGDLLISVANSANLLGRRTFISGLDQSKKYSFGAFMGCLRPDNEIIIPEYMSVFFGDKRYKQFCLSRANTTTNISNLNWSDLGDFEIPLPSLDIQRQIVAELEAEQELINANKKLIDIYTRKIKTKLAEIWGE